MLQRSIHRVVLLNSMTLAIAHAEGDRGVLDLVREWPAPFSPQQVVSEIVDIVRRYRVTSIVGDRYAGEWAREPFRNMHVDYVLADYTRSEAYLTMLPALNSGKIELLDDRRLITQLCGLERRTARSGRDTVDHQRGAKDDVVNAAALALVCAALLPKGSAENWIEYYRRLNEQAGTLPGQQASVKQPEFGYAVTPPAVKKRRIRVPQGITTLYLIDGTSMLVPEDRKVEVSAEDATALAMRGWERLAIV